MNDVFSGDFLRMFLDRMGTCVGVFAHVAGRLLGSSSPKLLLSTCVKCLTRFCFKAKYMAHFGLIYIHTHNCDGCINWDTVLFAGLTVSHVTWLT